MTAHSTACEWSTDPNIRCRCECQGRLHGIAEVRQRVLGEFLDAAVVVGEEPAEGDES